MLREIKNVRQEHTRGRRRWFESESLDLVVWIDATEHVTGFQLCYAKGQTEFALTWRAGLGFSHHAIDSGDDSPLKNCAPVLKPDGRAPWELITRLFEESSASLEPELRHLVQSRLVEGQDR